MNGPGEEPQPAVDATQKTVAQHNAHDRQKTHELATRYLELGYKVIVYPKAQGEKGPREAWEAISSVAELESKRFRWSDNTCLAICVSDKQVYVDLDANESALLASSFLPETRMISGRPGRARTHWWYNLSGTDTSRKQTKFEDPSSQPNERAMLVEYVHVSAKTRQKNTPIAISPPSPYDDEPFLRRATWDIFDGAATVGADALFQAVNRLAAASILLRCWRQGERNTLTLALSGALLRSGWQLKAVQEFLTVVALSAGDDEIENRLAQQKPAEARLAGKPPQNVYGWPKLEELIGTKRAQQVKKFLTYDSESASDAAGAKKTKSGDRPESKLASAVDVIGPDEFRYLPKSDGWLSLDQSRTRWLSGRKAELDVRAYVRKLLNSADQPDSDTSTQPQTPAQAQAQAQAQQSQAQAQAQVQAQDEISGLFVEMKHIENVMKALQEKPTLQILPDQLDDHDYLLNMPEGTFDLQRELLRQHDSSDLLTRIVPVSFDPDAKAPLWERQLELMWPDASIRSYVQRAIGYSLSGVQSERAFFLLYGTGRNGKSLFLRVVEMAIGKGESGYARQINPSAFTKRSFETELHSGLAQLRGVRFATVGEFPNRGLNSDLIKAITGGEQNTARELRQVVDPFRFQCKLWFSTNYRPGPTDTADDAFWSRMHSIPCEHQFPEPGEPGWIAEPELLNQLREELPGIMNWMLDGFRDWRREGLNTPNVLYKARKDYQGDSDLMAQFLTERCTVLEASKKEKPKSDDVNISTAWSIFDTWASEYGFDRKSRGECRTIAEFKQRISHKGFLIQQVNGKLRIAGIKHVDDGLDLS